MATDTVTFRTKGFTLIELMIALVVLAILLSIAYPTYQEQVRKSRRAQAKAMLLDIAAREERYFTENNTYTTDFTELDFKASDVQGGKLYIDAHGHLTNASNGIYAIAIKTNDSCHIASCFIVEATAQGNQAEDKESGTNCTPLTLNSRGEKNPAECW